MPEPVIQYARSADGVRIAYASFGAGPVFILTNVFLAQFSINVATGYFTRILEGLGGHRRLVTYDGRGIGLSQRDIEDFSLDALVGDLGAVIDATGAEGVDLVGNMWMGPVAIAYTVRHPSRVRHLLLRGTYARAADITPWERFSPLVDLARTNWKLAWQVFQGINARNPPDRQDLSTLFETTTTGEDAARWLTQQYAVDVRDLAQEISVPTLVLHSRRDRSVRFALGQDLAARIPGARFVPFEDNSAYDSPSTWRMIDDFLLDAAEPRAEPARPAPAAPTAAAEAEQPAPAFRTIVFTDIEGHTAMMQRLGDEAGRAVLREHERITRVVLKSHGGEEVKTIGDAFMATFRSATRAMECAIELQRAFATYNETAHEKIVIRAGLNAGEPIAEDSDYFGTSVILAQRIAGSARGGEILVPDVVRQLVAGRGFEFADRGEASLKGFDDAVRLHEVRWQL